MSGSTSVEGFILSHRIKGSINDMLKVTQVVRFRVQRFTVNPDFIGIFFMLPERRSVFPGLCVPNRFPYQKSG